MRLAHPTLVQPLKKLTQSRVALVATIVAILLAVSAVTFGYSSLSTEVTLSVDGKERTISTMADTVGDVLEDEGIEVADRDVVQPGLDEVVSEGDRIAVRFSRPIELTIDGKTATHWVTATDVDSALEQIGAAGVLDAAARISLDRGAGISRDGAEIEVVTPKTLTFKLAGRKPVKRTVAALTVTEALAEVGVTLDKLDRTRPRRTTELEDGDRVVFHDIEVKKRSVDDEAVPAPVREIEDDSMFEGDEEVETEGVDGLRDVTYQLRFRNGKVVKRTVLSQDVTREPVTEVVRVGTKEVAPNYAGGDSVWDRLAQCESGGNWATNTGNGYYGGLQFSASTWHSVGGSGLPHQHSREEQIKRGKILQARAGWGQWPHCTAQLGLR